MLCFLCLFLFIIYSHSFNIQSSNIKLISNYASISTSQFQTSRILQTSNILKFNNKNSLNMISSYDRCTEYAEYLKKPRFGGKFGSILRYLNIGMVATVFVFILRILNNLKVYGKENLMNLIWNRPKTQGLLTVSNHMSVMDDPGLWSAMLPWYRMRPEQMRWSVCTDDVFFCLNGKMAPIFGGGNVIPLDRRGSLEQPLFKRFFEKLNGGSWCHIFAEGRVWQSWRFDKNETNLGKFKFGVGKLIAHSVITPLVVPVYHRGMDKIIPEKQYSDNKKRKKKPSVPMSIIPRMGKTVHMHIGDPIDFSSVIKDFNNKYPGMLSKWSSSRECLMLYEQLTEKVRQEVVKLEAKSFQRDTVTNDATVE